nr:hypothetical protein [uncultured archaeon]
MPLGNLTSQFFANVYLNELDQFVKHELRAKYYIRYVDDFVILHTSKQQLETWKQEIEKFLKIQLLLHLHPDKAKIVRLGSSITFLGLRIFYNHKLLKKSNMQKMRRKIRELTEEDQQGTASYDILYDYLEGWVAYAKNANTYRLRKRVTEQIRKDYPEEFSSKEIGRLEKESVEREQ